MTRKNPPKNPRNGVFIAMRKDHKGNMRRTAIRNKNGKEVSRKYLDIGEQTEKGKEMDAQRENVFSVPDTPENRKWLEKYGRNIDVKGVDTPTEKKKSGFTYDELHKQIADLSRQDDRLREKMEHGHLNRAEGEKIYAEREEIRHKIQTLDRQI